MERLTENVLGNIQLKACGNDFCKETCAEHDEEKSCNNYPIQKAFEKLSEYEDLEEQGKLLKLPCEIGHRVYMIYQFCGEGAWEIEERKIRLEDLENIGKTVFLTREEAETALKELERGKHERAGKDLDSG